MSQSREQSILNAKRLGIFALAVTLVLSVVFHFTKDRITTALEKAEQTALLEVIGDQTKTVDIGAPFTLSNKQKKVLNTNASSSGWALKKGGSLVGYILPSTAPDGYSGNIDMLIGIDLQGNLLGVRVINHRETPGLGDKIEIKKSDWIQNFSGLSLRNPFGDQWQIKKDGGQFDAFTGATITPRAVVRQVAKTLQLQGSDRLQLASVAKESISDNNHESE